MENLPIKASDDIVRVRQQVRAAATTVGMSLIDQTKVVTAASELARNTLVHGGGGTARVEVLPPGPGRESRLLIALAPIAGRAGCPRRGHPHPAAGP